MNARAILHCAAAATLVAFPSIACAWGEKGHEIISRLAAQHLPAEVPAFVRAQAAVDELAMLGPEEDRLKGAGTSWDDDNDPGHYLDVGDDGRVAGAIGLSALPKNMERYELALERAGTDPYRMGFLPYSIMDGFERVRKDFAIWRVDAYLATRATTAQARARANDARKLREVLTLRDIGDWSHFVADGSQPLHVTVHYNGWGRYPNPNGFSTSRRLHAMFESEFVDAHVTSEDVARDIKPYRQDPPGALLTQRSIASIVGAYLARTNRAVPQLYEIDKAGGFASGSPQAVAFTSAQLARGATMLRNLIALAWEDSLNESVGYPPIPVRDVLSGKAVPRSLDD
jgi:hypothetical protein